MRNVIWIIVGVLVMLVIFVPSKSSKQIDEDADNILAEKAVIDRLQYRLDSMDIENAYFKRKIDDLNHTVRSLSKHSQNLEDEKNNIDNSSSTISDLTRSLYRSSVQLQDKGND